MTGYAGKTDLDQAKADMIIDCVDDMLRPIMPAYREKNEQKKVSHAFPTLDSVDNCRNINPKRILMTEYFGEK